MALRNLIIFVLLTPYAFSRVIETKQTDDSVLENIFSYFQDNKDSFYSFYENARLFTDILSMTNSPIIDNIIEVISPKSTFKRSIRSLDNFVNHLPSLKEDITNKMSDYVPKIINEWMVPQIFEKITFAQEEFLKSSLGKKIMDQIDTVKIKRIFSDEKTGNFSYDKFLELMENHSFRKHWISVVTKKVSEFICFYSNAETHERFASTISNIINTYLQKIGVPRSNLLDLENPNESLSELINFLSKNYLLYPIDSRKYVEPLILYVRNLFFTAREVIGHKTDPDKLENILTNTINMDIIEPNLRVNRAYRFLIQYPYCDRYVMCLVNSEEEDDPSLPGVKKVLSKGASLVASWFLAGKTKSSFATLYNDVMKSGDCGESLNCRHFHVEELKVKLPYEHKEL